MPLVPKRPTEVENTPYHVIEPGRPENRFLNADMHVKTVGGIFEFQLN